MTGAARPAGTGAKSFAPEAEMISMNLRHRHGRAGWTPCAMRAAAAQALNIT
jgi:hypothetical protein